MAASKMVQQIRDITECPLCMERYTKPKVLPCIHTFCLQCLQTYGRDKAPGENIACPLCKRETAIPAGGFDALPGNFLIDKLLDAETVSDMSETTMLCDICVENNDDATLINNALVHCVECSQNYCDACLAAHQRMKLLKTHQVVNIGDQLGLPGYALKDRHDRVELQQRKGVPDSLYCVDVPKKARKNVSERVQFGVGGGSTRTEAQPGPLTMYLATPSLLTKITSSDKPVHGLTLMGDRLYTVRWNDQKIEQYNAATFRRCARNIYVPVTVTGKWDIIAVDLASCNIHNCLYVCDYAARCVHRVQLPAGSLTKWDVPDQLCTLSVTPTSTVIITCQFQNKMYEFTTDGVLLRDVVLQPRIKYPEHTTMLPSGLLLFCRQGGLDLCASDGHVVTSYNGTGSSAAETFHPVHVVLHQGLVLVVDNSNHCIQLLTADLTYIQHVVTHDTHGLSRYPRRLCLDEKTGRLFIASNCGTIQVYKILDTIHAIS